jgi:hypothetical protein
MKKFFCIFLILLVVSAINAFACVCALPEKTVDDAAFEASAKKQFDSAFVVFTGEVSEWQQTELKFKLEKVWKGDIKNEYQMSTGTRKISEDLWESSSCDYTFQKGEKYLVFAYKTDKGDVQAYDCSLTQKLKNAERTIRFLDLNAKKVEKEFSNSQVITAPIFNRQFYFFGIFKFSVESSCD